MEFKMNKECEDCGHIGDEEMLEYGRFNEYHCKDCVDSWLKIAGNDLYDSLNYAIETQGIWKEPDECGCHGGCGYCLMLESRSYK
jgi:hypothetical protein